MRAPLSAALPMLLAAGHASAQTLGQATESHIAWWRVIAALLLCLALGVAGAYALRARLGTGGTLPKVPWRLGAAPTRRLRLRLVEAVRVSPQVEICLVACDDTEYLIALSAQAVTVLSSSPVGERS